MTTESTPEQRVARAMQDRGVLHASAVVDGKTITVSDAYAYHDAFKRVAKSLGYRPTYSPYQARNVIARLAAGDTQP